MRRARRHSHSLGVKFGAGDTEFIPWSDGNGCCGASELTQPGASHFTANFVGVIRASLIRSDKRVRFESLLDLWSPDHSIGNYMDWRRRLSPDQRDGRSDWLAFMARRWNGGKSPYSPSFFDGVAPTDEIDAAGFRIHDYATAYAEHYGSEEPVTELIPAMLAAFLDSDRDFVRNRKK